MTKEEAFDEIYEVYHDVSLSNRDVINVMYDIYKDVE